MTGQVDSVKVVVDDLGNAVSRMEYLPYGETWFQEGDESHSPKYNSQELDKESGYYFYNARHYDPAIGRFVTADTVIDGEGDTQGWNRFSYVKGNPVCYRDPSGHLALNEHFMRTYEAARKFGKGRLESIKLGAKAAWVDFRGSSVDKVLGTVFNYKPGKSNQGLDSKSTSVHAMAGKKKDGQYQTKKEAIKSTNERIKKALKENDLPLAIHTSQDLQTPDHSGKKWKGFTLNPLTKDIFTLWKSESRKNLKENFKKVKQSVTHIINDTFPNKSTKSWAKTAAFTRIAEYKRLKQKKK